MQNPDNLGPYRLLEALGKGGMGVVYRGVPPDGGPHVAVKTVQLVDRRRMDCIRREIHALQRIDHPGVVRILDQGVDGGVPWYAMELMEGRSLRDWFRGVWANVLGVSSLSPSALGASTASAEMGAVLEEFAASNSDADERLIAVERRPWAGNSQLDEMLWIIAQLCRTLAYLHGLGIVHGDLKPDNIFLRAGQAPVLVDFGLVSSFGGRRSREVIDTSGYRAGTYAYMSPEQIRGDLVDARTDLYALGVMLYEAVVGRLPFLKGSLLVMHQHLTAAPPAPSRWVNGLPVELEGLILALMAKRPQQRPGHADDVASRLEGFVGRSAPVGPAPRPYLYRAGFAGRDVTMQALLERYPDGGRAGGVILIGGESGVGKTRFAMEFARRLSLPRLDVITSECSPLGVERGAPLHPLLPLLTAVADQCWEGGHEETDRLLGVRGKRLGRLAPALLKVPGMSAYREPPTVSDEVARQQLMNDLTETLEAYARDRSVVLVMDDVQWADALTRVFLRSLDPVALHLAGVLVVLTYRLEEAHEDLNALISKAGVQSVRLERLEQRAVGQIVADMLALKTAPEPFVEFVTTESEGNPFFVAEYLRAAVDEGFVRRDGMGRWQLPSRRGQRLEALSVPGGIQELVGRRLDRLSARAQAMLARASVLGREFQAELLFDLANLDEVERFEVMEELITAHIFEEDRPGHVRFLHDKLREGGYARLTGGLRVELHGRAAEAIESRYRGTVELVQRYPELVHHWRIAERPRKLVETLERAAFAAMDTLAFADALRYLEEALELPESSIRVGARRRARWARRAGHAAFSVGDIAAADRLTTLALQLLGHRLPRSQAGWGLQLGREVVRQAIHRAGLGQVRRDLEEQDQEDLREAALAAALLAERFYFQNDAPALFSCALLSVNLGESTGYEEREGTPYAWIGYAAGSARLHGWARWYFDRGVECSVLARDTHAQSFCRILEAVYATGFARFDQGRRALNEAQARVDAPNDPQNHELIETVWGHIEYYTGLFDASRVRYERVLEAARRRENAQHTSWGLFSIARSLIRLGRFAEAQALLHDAYDLVEKLGDRASAIIVAGLLAEASLRLGEDADARTAANQAFELMSTSSPTAFSTLDGYWGTALTYLDLWQRKDDSGGELARRAKECGRAMTRLGWMFPLARPAALLYEGEILRVEGRELRAVKLFQQSAQLAQGLGMPFHAAMAEVSLGRSTQLSSAARDGHLASCWRTFAELGCVYHVRLVESLHRT